MLIFQALRCLSLKLSFKGKRYAARSLSPRYNSGCRPYPRHGDIWVLLAGDWICLEGNREAWGQLVQVVPHSIPQRSLESCGMAEVAAGAVFGAIPDLSSHR